MSWKDFVMDYDPSFSSCSIKDEDGIDYQPLNFEELIRMAFWESFYDTFGHRVTSFLFIKCILIFTVEPTVYLIITSVKCCIPLRTVKRSNLKPRTVLAKKGQSASSKITVTATNYALSSVKSHNVLMVGTSTSSNTVTTKTTCNSVSSTPHPQKIVVEGPSTSTKVVITTTSNSALVKPSLKRKQDAISSALTSYKAPVPAVPSKRSKNEEENCIIRWITPKEKILEAVIADREKTKEKHRVSSVQSKNPTNLTEYNVLGVLRDSFFLDRAGPLDLISKSSSPIILNGPLPKGCDGLRLPKDFISDGEKVMLNVYKMSETQAKKFKIRIKPRQRKNKGKNKSGSVVVPENENLCQEIMEIDEEADVDFSECFKPYNANQPLPTDSILYNKSSWAKLPTSHFARKVISMNEEDGINVLMAEMLHIEIDLLQLVYSKRPNEFIELRKMSTSIIYFHKKVKDIHRMIKSCLMHWIMSHVHKVILKSKAKMQRRDRCRKLKMTKISTQNLTESSIGPGSMNVIQMAKSTTGPTCSSLESEKSRHSSASVIPHNLRHLSQYFPSDSESRSKSTQSKDSNNILTQSVIEIQEKGKNIVFQKLKEAIPHSCILSTMSQVLHLSGAEKLLGSNRNKRAFIAFVKKSVMMGGLRSSLHLGQLVSSLHPEDCCWLTHIKNQVVRQRVFSSVLQWLFSDYVLTFIKTSFYGTEVSNSRNQIVFYLRDTWKSVTDKLKDRFINKRNLRRIDASKGKQVNSRLRLLPKQNNNIRPLISFTDSTCSTLNHTDCRQLVNLLISKRYPQGFQDANGVRAKWSAFHQNHIKNKNVPLYYVRADIKDAYASVNLKLLKDILINSFFGQGNFLRKTYSVLSVGSPFSPKERCSLLDRDERTNWHASIFTRPCIIRDTKKNSVLDAKSLILNLVRALDPNVLRLGKHDFEFEFGLPQGWIMSQHLCNIYYGQMEKVHLSEFLERPEELFIRNVDDYFFVSTNPHRISKFCDKMKNGIKEYNCKVNLTKWTTNLQVHSNTVMPDTICDWVPFCGWKFCLATGHVCRDFSSYKGADICSTVTFKMSEKIDSDAFIIKRMGVVTPLRLSSLFFDPVFNCRRRIITNIFDAGLMLAFRFYAICRVVYPNLASVTTGTRVTALFTAIHQAAKCLSNYIVNGSIYFYPFIPAHLCYNQNQKQSCQRIFKSPKCNLQILPSAAEPLCSSTPIEDLINTPISQPEVIFLVYHAFIAKFSKHTQVFQNSFLPRLRKARSNQRAKLSERQYIFLIETVGFKMPEHFIAIKK